RATCRLRLRGAAAVGAGDPEGGRRRPASDAVSRGVPGTGRVREAFGLRVGEDVPLKHRGLQTGGTAFLIFRQRRGPGFHLGDSAFETGQFLGIVALARATVWAL